MITDILVYGHCRVCEKFRCTRSVLDAVVDSGGAEPEEDSLILRNVSECAHVFEVGGWYVRGDIRMWEPKILLGKVDGLGRHCYYWS